MRDAGPCRWQRWRVALAARPAAQAAPRFARKAALVPAESPGVDGIRHELVARVRREIEAGTYDTEEKWLAAEEKLLRRVEEAM